MAITWSQKKCDAIQDRAMSLITEDDQIEGELEQVRRKKQVLDSEEQFWMMMKTKTEKSMSDTMTARDLFQTGLSGRSASLDNDDDIGESEASSSLTELTDHGLTDDVSSSTESKMFAESDVVEEIDIYFKPFPQSGLVMKEENNGVRSKFAFATFLILCNYFRAYFRNCVLENVTFYKCKFSNISFYDIVLQNVVFKNCRFKDGFCQNWKPLDLVGKMVDGRLVVENRTFGGKDYRGRQIPHEILNVDYIKKQACAEDGFKGAKDISN